MTTHSTTTKEALEPCPDCAIVAKEAWRRFSDSHKGTAVLCCEKHRVSAPIAPVVDEDLRNAFVQAAIEVHVGFQHPRPWADCDMAICNERKRLSQQPSTEADSADDAERDQAFREFWREQERERPFDYQHPERYATFTERYAPPAPASTVAPVEQSDDESRALLNQWIQQDVEATSKQSLLKLAWSLGVAGNHEHEVRECLLSVPELHLEDYPGGVAEIGPLDIQEDCLRAIDYLKTLIVLLNRLAIGDLDPAESKRVVAESTEYLERMRSFPIRSQHERAKSDRD